MARAARPAIRERGPRSRSALTARRARARRARARARRVPPARRGWRRRRSRPAHRTDPGAAARPRRPPRRRRRDPRQPSVPSAMPRLTVGEYGMSRPDPEMAAAHHAHPRTIGNPPRPDRARHLRTNANDGPFRRRPVASPRARSSQCAQGAHGSRSRVPRCNALHRSPARIPVVRSGHSSRLLVRGPSTPPNGGWMQDPRCPGGVRCAHVHRYLRARHQEIR